VENSLAEDDEEHRRTDRGACIAFREGFGPNLKAEEKQAAESGQRHNGGKRLRRQRKEPAVKKDAGFSLR
jgi:hypothetical protein